MSHVQLVKHSFKSYILMQGDNWEIILVMCIMIIILCPGMGSTYVKSCKNTKNEYILCTYTCIILRKLAT